jgi:heme a synthase
MQTAQANKGVVAWLLSGCFLIFLMVIIGGITRLTNSGLSMVEWSLIMGAIPPLSEEAWLVAFEKYKQFPEFQKLHYHFRLEDFKSIFFWEYLHRMIGRFIGIVFIVPFLYFWKSGRISKSLMPKLLIIFAMGAFQGFLGWYMVKSGLVDKPYVSHYRLAIHLMAAFATFGFTLWVAFGEYYKNKQEQRQAGTSAIYKLGLGFLILLTVQVIYGAFVAGLKAGYVYNTFPKMGSRWIAEGVTAMEPFYLNFLEGLAGVQFIHRYIAYALLILAVVIWVKSRKIQLSKAQQNASRFLLGIVLIQATLGVFTLLFKVPVSLGVLHQAGAFILLSCNLFFLYQMKAEVKKKEQVVQQEEVYA